MNEKESELYFLSLVLIPSYNCNSRCRHCYPECVPRFGADWDMEFVKKVIEQGSRLPDSLLARNIHFAGGEPFLYFDELVESCAFAMEKGFYPSVVTNGFWATSVKKAEEKIKPLIDAGLFRVELSIDSFHQEFIPLRSVRNALMAFRKFKIQILIRTTITKRNDAWTALGHIPPQELVGTKIVISPVSPEGRAVETIPAEDFIYAPFINGCCFNMLNISVRFDGNVSPCCAGSDTVPLLSLGNINQESLEDMLHRLNYRFYIKALLSRGPAELMTVLTEGGLGNHLKERYTTICHACTHIFRFRENSDYLENYYRRQKAEQLSELLSDFLSSHTG